MIRTHDEIKLTASSADLLISPRLGTYLPVEVYLDTCLLYTSIRRQQAAGVSRKSTLAVVIAKLGHKEIGIFDSVISDFLTILLRFLNFVNFRRFLFLSYAILRWYLKKAERKC